MNTLTLLQAEWLKTKRAAPRYLPPILCGLLLVAICIGFLSFPNLLAAFDQDPWFRIIKSIQTIFVVFLLLPTTILLVAAFAYLEDRADSSKFSRTLPVGSEQLYLAQLGLLLVFFTVFFLLAILAYLLIGLLIGVVFPEYEFFYFSPHLVYFSKRMGHAFLASLGALSFQYFLSRLFPHFLIAVGIGFALFIFSFVIMTLDSTVALYLPYAWPMIVQDYGLALSTQTKNIMGGWLVNVELFSLLAFFGFAVLGWLFERRRFFA